MTQLKRCPHCFRTYPDITLNFCLDDGSVLSDSFREPEQTESMEIETRLRIQKEKIPDKSELDAWQYEKTERTQSEHPISSSPKTSDRPFSQWTSSDFVRDVTFQITGRHTFHAQECLELLRHFLNSFIGNEDQVLRRSSWQLGKAHFYTYGGRFTYDFQKQAHPSARDFLLRLLAFVTGSQPEIETVIRLRNIEEDRPSADADARLMGGGQTKRVQTQGEAGFEYIRAAVAKHPNLGIKVHPGNNHRITKSGHTGSIWIIPRHGGVSITANGQAAQRLYREMERILGPHHREDAKGYRYFQADKSNDVETIIGLWSRM